MNPGNTSKRALLPGKLGLASSIDRQSICDWVGLALRPLHGSLVLSVQLVQSLPMEMMRLYMRPSTLSTLSEAQNTRLGAQMAVLGVAIPTLRGPLHT